MSVLDDLELLISNTKYSQIIIIGDWNTDFKRLFAQTSEQESFISRNNLLVTWAKNKTGFRENTYLNFSLSQFSCIDHFCVSNNIFDLLTTHSVRNDSINPSNHSLSPIEIPSFVNINNSSYMSYILNVSHQLSLFGTKWVHLTLASTKTN